ncbi:hypothetical protein NE664_10555 [Anaerotignum faecicola]|nr:hypothetical protein [Anaerotignum faecicola]
MNKTLFRKLLSLIACFTIIMSSAVFAEESVIPPASDTSVHENLINENISETTPPDTGQNPHNNENTPGNDENGNMQDSIDPLPEINIPSENASDNEENNNTSDKGENLPPAANPEEQPENGGTDENNQYIETTLPEEQEKEQINDAQRAPTIPLSAVYIVDIRGNIDNNKYEIESLNCGQNNGTTGDIVCETKNYFDRSKGVTLGVRQHGYHNAKLRATGATADNASVESTGVPYNFEYDSYGSVAAFTIDYKVVNVDPDVSQTRFTVRDIGDKGYFTRTVVSFSLQGHTRPTRKNFPHFCIAYACHRNHYAGAYAP